jgi:hypothetical protein
MVNKIEIKEKNNINLYFLGDWHIGAKSCDEVALLKTLRIINRDRKARVILMGDLGEYIFQDDTRRYDVSNVNKTYSNFEEQTKTILKYLKPIKHKIYGMLRGNHEATFSKYHPEIYEEEKYRDESEYLCQQLKINYLEDLGIVTLKIKNHTYNIVVAHGIGGGTTLSGQINSLRKIVDGFEIVPDVVAMGHVHTLQTIINPKLTFNFKTKIKHLALTGSYYRTYIEKNMNYASSNLYNPLPVGCVMYNLTDKGEIKDNKLIFEK